MQLNEYISVSPEMFEKIVISLVVLIVFSIGRIVLNLVVKRKFTDARRAYHYRRFILYTYTVLLVLIIGRIWVKGIDSITTFLGLATAGIAIAMHDTIANLAGWLFIIWRKPFSVGDRIEIGGVAGDVIDIRIFQFSLIEIGNWVDADQSTGRIIHIPNSKALREPLANYQIGFEHIWNEIPVLITFESNWKKAKEILNNIVLDKTMHLSKGAQDQIRNAAKKYFIFYDKLTPIVYTSVKDSGVLLTLRYLVKPRERRITEQQIWEAILDAFGKDKEIDLAYPTTRFYSDNSECQKGIKGSRMQGFE
ncbi:MAG: mechanosensitive ion channel family protein [Proteobacteria bacterium]|nr:mechanosensitive ion channel family protein [Pseudomonadota bacterium]